MEPTDELIDRLVELHGEDGLAPSRDDWTRILALPRDEPVLILNLLRFQATVEIDGDATSGADVYNRYSRAVGPAFVRAGARLLHNLPVHHAFGTPPSDGADDDAGRQWDRMVLSQYPSPRALAEFWLDEQFVEGHHHRVHGVDRSAVLVLPPA